MTLQETSHGGNTTFRKMECPCGSRFESEERIARRLPPAPARARRQAPASAEAPPPTPAPANPPPSGGGIGGPLPGGVTSSVSTADSDPNPKASLLSVPRARARTKTPASPHFAPMRDRFVERWEEQYGEKYLFEPRDGAALARMIARHPETVERWDAMITRYLGNEFWASKRHPLTGIASRPGEFSGDTNGIPRRTKWDDSRETTFAWSQRSTG